MSKASSKVMEIKPELPSPAPVVLDPSRSLLVIVDMQNEFCRKDGVKYAPMTEAVIPKLKALLDRARKNGLPILYTQGLRSPKSPEIAEYKKPPNIMLGSWGAEIVDELRPKPHEYIVKKYTHDCFHGTEMDGLLTNILRAEPLEHRVIVTGVASNVCVYHAIMGFHIRHYWVVVPLDCIAASSGTLQAMAVAMFTHRAYSYNVTATTSDMISFQGKAK